MGLKLSRKIRSVRNNILFFIKEKNIKIYKILLFSGAFFKFLYKLSKKKTLKYIPKILTKLINMNLKKHHKIMRMVL